MVNESRPKFQNYGSIGEIFTIINPKLIKKGNHDAFMKTQPVLTNILPEYSSPPQSCDTPVVELTNIEMRSKHRQSLSDRNLKQPLLLDIEADNGPPMQLFTSNQNNQTNNDVPEAEPNGNFKLNKEQTNTTTNENHQQFYSSSNFNSYVPNNVSNSGVNYNTNNNNNNNETTIEITDPKPNGDESYYPDEILKTFLAFIILVMSFIMTLTAIAVVHDKVPDREKYAPLPDVFLNHVPMENWALSVSEYLIMLSIYTTMLLVFCHRYRWIVMRRIFLIMSLLYILRAITMYVTVLPMPNRTYKCAPKNPHVTIPIILSRIVYMVSGFGLTISGKVIYCGDSIYSGHTVTLVLSYLIITEYSPKKFHILHWVSSCVTIFGVFFLLLSHGHYTIDVLIAYYITTRSFWTYHTLANNLSMKRNIHYNYFVKEWWFPVFCYFEKNVNGVVPRRYHWPLPWPSRFRRRLI